MSQGKPTFACDSNMIGSAEPCDALSDKCSVPDHVRTDCAVCNEGSYAGANPEGL